MVAVRRATRFAGMMLLLDYLVDDRPTVPATVMIEIAAEVAAALVPGQVPVRFTEAEARRGRRSQPPLALFKPPSGWRTSTRASCKVNPKSRNVAPPM